MATVLIAVGAGATAARYGIVAWNRAWTAFKSRPAKFYQGGFDPQMTRREALLILGIKRESRANEKMISEAYRKVMVANHPDAGGSHYLASKIGEAKDILMKKPTNPGSAF